MCFLFYSYSNGPKSFLQPHSGIILTVTQLASDTRLVFLSLILVADLSNLTSGSVVITNHV